MFKLKLYARRLRVDEWLDMPGPDEVYAEFSLVVQDSEDRFVRKVFHVRWGIHCFFDWVVENKKSILSERFPAFGVAGYSIPQNIGLFYDVVDMGDDAKLNEMHGYITRHGLDFSLRGVDMPHAYIGLNSTGWEI